MLSIFDLIAILLALSAAFAYINCKVLRLPHTIGVLVMGMAASLVLIALEKVVPEARLYKVLTDAILRIDFAATFLNGMLAFLLFAGALHVDASRLKKRAITIGYLATAGVVISTLIVGFCFYWLCRMLGTPMTLLWAMVLGALISPTDAVAVLSTFKTVKLPEELEIEMTGESLLNDGASVVLFTVLVAAAASESGRLEFGIGHIIRLIFFEGLGGALLGVVTGYVCHLAMRSIDDYGIEVLISIALAMGTYALASRLHVSGPIAVVAAGLLIGGHRPHDKMSDETQKYLFQFWTLIDEILNSVLFLLLGLEVLILRNAHGALWLAIASIPIVLFARFVSVTTPVLSLFWHLRFPAGTIPLLTWGGVRGGISVALVLSLPEFPEKPILLAVTYAVVLFSLIVQGLTLGPLVRRIVPQDPTATKASFHKPVPRRGADRHASVS